MNVYTLNGFYWFILRKFQSSISFVYIQLKHLFKYLIRRRRVQSKILNDNKLHEVNGLSLKVNLSCLRNVLAASNLYLRLTLWSLCCINIPFINGCIKQYSLWVHVIRSCTRLYLHCPQVILVLLFLKMVTQVLVCIFQQI